MSDEAAMIEPQRITDHRGSDDLLTGGLGLEGLRSAAAPAFADPVAPTPAELRRRALWSNWRGIADLSPGGGYGSEYGSVANVPGREFSALATLPGARQPHRVLVQVPDAFDRRRRCVVVTASSGSRGIYGAIAVAGVWGLPRGYAVAYTDKGAGSDYFDFDTGTGVRLDGTRGTPGETLAFMPEGRASASGVAFKHAHSADHPEADWGRHVKQAAEFALAALSRAFPDAPAFTFDNTRVIAVGISNGGGAVLRAAELAGDWLDAAVAGAPNVFIHSPDTRALYDYATQAALLMPGALLHLPAESLPEPPLRAQSEAAWQARCASLRQAGWLSGNRVPAQAASAYWQLRDSGWTEAALTAGALSVGFDFWRAIAATYAAAYARAGVDAHPCGYRFSAQAADGTARAATAAERAAWFADGSGIPPGAGVGIVDPNPNLPGEPAADPTFAGLKCLRELLDSSADQAFAQALAATVASPPRDRLPVMVIHGLDDGLIPAAFGSTPYVAAAQAAGRRVGYWQVRRAQHFDSFLALPGCRPRYVAMLPYVYAALDQMDAHLDGLAGPPADAVIEAVPRGTRQVQAGDFKFPTARAGPLA
ncbi:MAG TPA: 3-hydroxybutyrate oligomer hydrolase family protein [Pseudoxanthomonas sp.]|nr:3-hydroxybutyrate oligomer hydrolase family protein [Pseudoxanthomonas sp.]